MNTLAHSTLSAPAAPDARRSGRAPLHAAVEAAPAARPVPFLTRLRHPFARREPTVRSLIRKHRLWPALEFAYDELARDFGPLPMEISVEGLENNFPYVSLHTSVASEETSFVFDQEDSLSEKVRRRFGRKVSLRLLITVHRDLSQPSLFD